MDLESPTANMTTWQAVHSSPTPLFPVRSMGLPMLWSSVLEKDRKPFDLCGLTLL